eukprot:GFKZ01009938.1.p1 GENE.GFKZ01009938.1~~GFKZ01009938.1.p1  ORF type:complete len:248 (+),score=42.80 GFKZ01009938.1:295-1038(+)
MDTLKPVLEALDAIITDVEKALNPPKQPLTKAPAGEIPAVKAANQHPTSNSPPADKKQKKKKEKKPKQPAPPPVDPVVAQFLQCDLRVGRILEVGPHAEAEALYVMKISVGTEDTRTVCAGLRKFVPEEEMLNRMVVTICNLKPRKLRGVPSEAMVLAGSVVSGEGEKETVVPVDPPPGATEGALIAADGVTGERTVTPGKFVSGKVWDKVVPRLSVKDGIACYNGQPMRTDQGAVVCKLPDGAEIH